MDPTTTQSKTIELHTDNTTYWLQFFFDGSNTVIVRIIDTTNGQSYELTFTHATNTTLTAITEETTKVTPLPDESLQLDTSAFANAICTRQPLDAAQRLCNQNSYLRWLTKPHKGPLELSKGWKFCGGNYSHPSYSRVGNMANLSGLVIRKSDSKKRKICILPEELRPNRVIILAAHCYDARVARIDIQPNGEVLFRAGNAGHVSLDGLPTLSEHNPKVCY